MLSQPLPKRKKLEDDAVAKMIKQTAVKPLERQAKIMEGLKMNNNSYKKDPFANEFGGGRKYEAAGHAVPIPQFRRQRIALARLQLCIRAGIVELALAWAWV